MFISLLSEEYPLIVQTDSKYLMKSLTCFFSRPKELKELTNKYYYIIPRPYEYNEWHKIALILQN